MLQKKCKRTGTWVTLTQIGPRTFEASYMDAAVELRTTYNGNAHQVWGQVFGDIYKRRVKGEQFLICAHGLPTKIPALDSLQATRFERHYIPSTVTGSGV